MTENHIEREEILLSRVLDDEALDDDWAELETLAQTDPTLWRRLAQAKRDQDLLRAGFDDAISNADHIEIDENAAHAGRDFHIRLRAWSGWAAAAVIGLVFLTVQGILPRAQNTSQIHQAGLLSTATPAEALSRYMDAGQSDGRVLGELPKLMIDTNPLADGVSVEITFVRRIYERTIIRGVVEVEVNEHGEPTPILTPASNMFTSQPF